MSEAVMQIREWTQKNTRWIAFAIVCFFVFSLWKLLDLPFEQIVINQIDQNMPKEITLTAQRTEVSFVFGPKVIFEKPIIVLNNTGKRLEFDEIVAKPKLFSLITGNLGASAAITKGDSDIDLSFVAKGKSDFDIQVDLDNVDLYKTNLISALDGFVKDSFGVMKQLSKPGSSLLVDGSINLAGNMSNPSSLSGSIDLDFEKLKLGPLNLVMVVLPQLNVEDGEFDIDFNSGTAEVNSIRLGKKGRKDDIVANLSGNAKLGRNWKSGTLDLKSNFQLSENLMKKLALLKTLLAAGRKDDGSFAYKITGPLNKPSYVPDK